MEKIHKFTLDISKGITNTDIEIVTQDYASHKLEVSLVENGYKPLDLTDTIVRLIVRKTDGKTVQQDCSIIGDGQISVLLQLNTINVAGICKAEIQVWDNNVANKRLTSALFNFKVRQSLQDDETVESTDEFSMLQNALEQASDVEEKILNKTGILTEIEPSLQATLSDQGKDLNLVNVANAIYNETTKPDWTPALTQMKSIFSVGTGYKEDGTYVDYSGSINAKGQINVGIKGNTRINETKIKNGILSSAVGSKNSTVVENGYFKTTNSDLGITEFGDEIQSSEGKIVTFSLVGYGVNNGGSVCEYNIIFKDINGNILSSDTLSFLSDTSAVRKHITLATPTGTAKILIYPITNGGNIIYAKDIMVEETNELKPYITGTKSTLSHRIVSRGKNLINKNDTHRIVGYSISSSGSIAVSPTVTISHPIKVVAGNTYIKSNDGGGRIRFLDKNLGLISVIEGNTAVVPSNAIYIQFAYITANEDIVQIEEGTTATEYEEYKESISYVQLPKDENGNQLEMNSLPNGTKDEFYATS